MNKKAQSILEIVSLISLVTFAWLAMYGYFKSALQGNWKKNIDMFSDTQYEPGITYEESQIEYENPEMRAIIGQDRNIPLDITKSKILRINGWGRYYDEDEPD